MPLDFYYTSKKTNTIESFKMKDSEIRLLEQVFEELQKKTGVFIDPYGKCKIYPDHLKIIQKALEKSKSDVGARFSKFLDGAIFQEEVVTADGD
jgi:hypothetical protein